MCGLVSLISKRSYGFNSKDLDIFQEMLIVDQLRGDDATGAFCVHNNRQVSGIKGAFTPWHMFKTQEWDAFRTKADRTGRILVGHNRKATMGNSANPNNAHPFQEDNIILVHNGTLHSHRHLADKDVDSHAVAAAFAKGDYAEVLGKISGAYVFIWWDMERNRLSVVRNDQRPLFAFENDDMILLCSEAWMGQGVLRRNSREVNNAKDAKPSDYYVCQFPTDMVMHYEIGGNSTAETVKKAPVSVFTTRQTGTTTSTGHTAARGTGVVTLPKTTGTNRGLVTAREALAAAVKARTPAPKVVTPFRDVSSGFPINGEIVIQINEIKVDNANAPEKDQRFKAVGTTVQPGKPIVDVVGFLPDYVTHDQVARWTAHPVYASVTMYKETNCGPTLSVTNFRVPTLVETWPTGFITETDWLHAVEHCKCKACEKRVGEWDHKYTSVKRILTDANEVTLEVTCGDCIEDKINDIQVKEIFTTGRLAALSQWEQVLRSASPEIGRAIAMQGNTTTH